VRRLKLQGINGGNVKIFADRGLYAVT